MLALNMPTRQTDFCFQADSVFDRTACDRRGSNSAIGSMIPHPN
jgi:hypothetical protein